MCNQRSHLILHHNQLLIIHRRRRRRHQCPQITSFIYKVRKWK